MATQEVVLRPGDSISLKLEVPGQPLRLDLSLTPDGVSVSGPDAGPPPGGAPTIFGGVPPIPDAPAQEEEPVDLTAEFAAEDASAAPPADEPGRVESLAAVEPFDDPAEAVDIPMEDISESDPPPAQEVADSGEFDGDDLDLDLDDLGGEEEVTMDAAPAVDVPDDSLDLDDGDLDLGDDASGGLDIPGDEPASLDIPDEEPASLDIPDDDLSVDIPGGDDDLSVDIPGGDDDLSVDIPGGDDDLSVDIPGGDDDLSVDIPGGDDDLSVDIPGGEDDNFSADAMTMVPPTGGGDAGPNVNEEGVELDADGNPKEKWKPGDDDTLPVWTGKARTYRDPELEKKKETAKLDKGAKKKPTGKAPAVPGKGPKLPGKAKLPAGAKKPVTKQVKKPATGGVGPAKSAPGGGGGGNFTVFLSPPKGADKKQAAAEIIADIQGIDMNSAMTLAGKMIVPVVKGVSEDDAQNVRDRFKDAGLSCRITQKR